MQHKKPLFQYSLYQEYSSLDLISGARVLSGTGERASILVGRDKGQPREWRGQGVGLRGERVGIGRVQGCKRKGRLGSESGSRTRRGEIGLGVERLACRGTWIRGRFEG
eukprot:3096954-Rhodomonas_salina.2